MFADMDPPHPPPPSIRLHVFIFPFFPRFAAVGVVSQAVSMRNERGGTNYENRMTINAYVRFKCSRYDCLHLGLSLSLSLCLCLSLATINIQWLNRHLPPYSRQPAGLFFYVPLRAKLLNREADEVECRSRLHTTGPNLRREKSSFSLLFFAPPPFFFFILFPLTGRNWCDNRIWNCCTFPRKEGLGGGGGGRTASRRWWKENLCSSRRACQFCVSVSFECMWNDRCWDSSPE